ncbi:Spy/CpxP family protein refolding chaperone [Halomonas salina]|nr:Spy/CpxP family protein refolding chaperone [Halomonas salina]
MMMGGQGGMGPGMMMGGQGGMGPGMMMGGISSGMMPCPMMDGKGMGMQQMLDPEQRDEMRALMQEHRPAQFERLGRLMNLRDDLMAELHGERPDPEEVKTLHGRMAELHGEMMAEKVRLHNAMQDLLTAEQRQRLSKAPSSDNVAPEEHDSHH